MKRSKANFSPWSYSIDSFTFSYSCSNRPAPIPSLLYVFHRGRLIHNRLFFPGSTVGTPSLSYHFYMHSTVGGHTGSPRYIAGSTRYSNHCGHLRLHHLDLISYCRAQPKVMHADYVFLYSPAICSDLKAVILSEPSLC